jgi:hypothetical protein
MAGEEKFTVSMKTGQSDYRNQESSTELPSSLCSPSMIRGFSQFSTQGTWSKVFSKEKLDDLPSVA